MEKLTEKEKQAYEYIARTIREDGYAPSVRDIADALNIKSTSTVHAYLARLEEKGWITRTSGKSRSLRAVENGRPSGETRRTAKIPLLGRIRAGMPVLAVENLEEYIDFPMGNRSYSYNDLFALRVNGESMIGAGILDGDIVIVKKEPVVANGTMAVALIGDEATLKTFYREDGHIRLQPENPAMEPIIVTDCVVLGRVIATMRYY